MATLRITICVLCAAVLQASAASAHPDDLVKGFTSPPDTAKPYTWWHWLYGNMSRDGITRDLEAMKEVGLGGAQIFHAAPGVPQGPVAYLSPEWHSLMTHAFQEADRLGLELGMHNASGWSSTGGPWITPDLAMQVLVWTETRVQGPKHVDTVLPQPFAKKDFYRDAAVLAFPTPPADSDDLLSLHASITTSDPKQDAGKLIDRNRATVVALPQPCKENPPIVQLAFHEPFRAQALSIVPGGHFQSHGGELQAQTKDGTFRKVCDFRIPYAGNAQTYLGINFSPTISRIFRLVFTIPCRQSKTLVLAEIDLHGGFRIDRWRDKGSYTHYRHQKSSPCQPTSADVIDAKDIIDLTARVSPDGHLAWDAPAGDWTILRIGHTTTGTFNKPAGKDATGLECDKFSRAALDVHWKNLIEGVLKDAGPLAGKAFNNIHIDSFEVGAQNWTEKFPEEFRKRCGYDILPFLPILTGRVVTDLETSERFLWDMRKTCAELFRDNYYQYSAELCHNHGLIFSVEGYGESSFDSLPCSRTGDMPMAEFWVRPPVRRPGGRNKMAASSARLTGRQFVGAEAFTAHAEYGKWQNYPYSLKAYGDLAFCSGINRIIFHRYAHQPWNDRKPGMTMGPFGMHFERTITWWKQAPAFTEYLTRCQFLLQQGSFVADATCFVGEDSPTGIQIQPPPYGYDYDFCDAESIEQMSVRDGLLVHPKGMQYRLLTIRNDNTGMTPALLRKLYQLVQDGAIIVGPKPTSSPTLAGFPQSNVQVLALADELWGDCDGKTVTSHKFGKGRVFWGKSLNHIFLEDLKLPPDFDSGGKHHINTIHRRTAEADIYFVANSRPVSERVECLFRIAGRTPELWHPDTGKIEIAPVYTERDGQTMLPLDFGPKGSMFVVFRHPATDDHAVAVQCKVKEVAESAAELTILKAEYGAFGSDKAQKRTIDITDKLAELVKDGSLHVTIDNAFAGRDPASGTAKELRVEYRYDGQVKHAIIREKSVLTLPDNEKRTVKVPAYELTTDPDGALGLLAWEAGEFEVETASGKTEKMVVDTVPKPLEVSGPWRLSFPPNLGAPSEVMFPELISWPEHADPGVKYFSGTATYHTTFSPPQWPLPENTEVALDLGDVQVIAEVCLNGNDLGILWKPPFRVNVTGMLKAGTNSLEVRVTNLWPNRLIGDEFLPDNREWNSSGALKRWPEDVLEGKAPPNTGRVTWTTWRHYTKGSPLLPSGLIGPVKIQFGARKTLPLSAKE